MINGHYIIGSGAGDEGKGTVTAYCAKNSTGSILNVLTNGGPQRGHTVVTDKGTFTFKHFGSGTCYGAHNYFASEFIVNPIQFMKEFNELRQHFTVKTYMNRNCLWTTPYDMMANQIIERNRREKHAEHGTCGMGIWETMVRSSVMININLDSFVKMSLEEQISRLKNVKKYFEVKYFNGLDYSMTDEERNIWNNEKLAYNFTEDCIAMMHNVTVVDRIPKNYDNYLFENGQGLLLDGFSDDVDHTTPSCTGIQSFIEDDLSFIDNFNVHYVTRPYLTRHGTGPFKDVNRRYISSNIQDDLMNHYNEFQGKFRYGKLDISELKERVEHDFKLFNHANKNLTLEITHCDEMDRVDEFKKYFNNYHTFDSPRV